MVARDHDDVKIFRDVRYPVVLFESIVQIRHEETFHDRLPAEILLSVKGVTTPARFYGCLCPHFARGDERTT